MGRPISYQPLHALPQKIRRETVMTSTHEDTVFKISKTIFNTRIFPIEVI